MPKQPNASANDPEPVPVKPDVIVDKDKGVVSTESSEGIDGIRIRVERGGGDGESGGEPP